MATALPVLEVEYTSYKDAAAAFGLSPSSVRRLANAGQITTVRLGHRTTLVDVRSVRDFLDSEAAHFSLPNTSDRGA